MFLWEINWREPTEAFAPLVGEPYAHLLHAGSLANSAEWSILVANPSEVSEVNRDDKNNPFPQFDDMLGKGGETKYQAHNSLPFVSGLLGFVGYEAARFFEPTLNLPPSPFPFPDLSIGRYEAAALFSRVQRKVFVVGTDEKAGRRLRDVLGTEKKYVPISMSEPGNFKPSVSKQQYINAVSAAIENILDGDYYQVNLSHQLMLETSSDFRPFDFFNALCSTSDAAHGAFLQMPCGAIVSNSPERFFRVAQTADWKRRIVSEPIKGTRPRNVDQAKDKQLAKALISDPKDRAENIMIADLIRNDLSRICEDGTIHEEAICDLLSLTNVHHLVSRISGILCEEVGASDIFKALFPCGSITGTPKIEAMNAIARIENVGRGPYCGAIGYFDDRGGADFSVAIRSATFTDHQLTVPVGGGVTLRSNPYQEYEETLVKAEAPLSALGKNRRSVAV